jgi:hypothetical protein
MRKTGVWLIVLAYAVLLYSSLAAQAYGRAHAYLGLAVIAEYGSPWPVALGCAVAVAGIVLALIPIRRGERWAIWTSLAMLIILLATRLASDPRCLAVLDPHQHGCHTFMITVALGVAGLALAFTPARAKAARAGDPDLSNPVIRKNGG